MPTDTSGWVWWVGTTIVLAVLVNLASAYLKTPIDRQVEKFSGSLRMRNEKRRSNIQKTVERMKKDAAELFWVNEQLTRSYIRTIIWSIFLTLTFSLPDILGIITGFFSPYFFWLYILNFFLTVVLPVVISLILTILLLNSLAESRFYSEIMREYRLAREEEYQKAEIAEYVYEKGIQRRSSTTKKD